MRTLWTFALLCCCCSWLATGKITLSAVKGAGAGNCGTGNIELYHGTTKPSAQAFGARIDPQLGNEIGSQPMGPGFYCSTSMTNAQQSVVGLSPTGTGGIIVFCMPGSLEGELFPTTLNGNEEGGMAITAQPAYIKLAGTTQFFAGKVVTLDTVVVFLPKTKPMFQSLHFRYVELHRTDKLRPPPPPPRQQGPPVFINGVVPGMLPTPHQDLQGNAYTSGTAQYQNNVVAGSPPFGNNLVPRN